MKTYKTNPNRRCVHCNGREVLTTENDKTSTNLVRGRNNALDVIYFCADKRECDLNIISEQEKVKFDENGKIIGFTAMGLTVEATK